MYVFLFLTVCVVSLSRMVVSDGFRRKILVSGSFLRTYDSQSYGGGGIFEF